MDLKSQKPVRTCKKKTHMYIGTYWNILDNIHTSCSNDEDCEAAFQSRSFIMYHPSKPPL